MKRLPVVNVTSAQVKHAELSGLVTVGEETARLLSVKLGREVRPGEQFDLGVLSVYHSNPLKRFWASLKVGLRRHEFN